MKKKVSPGRSLLPAWFRLLVVGLKSELLKFCSEIFVAEVTESDFHFCEAVGVGSVVSCGFDHFVDLLVGHFVSLFRFAVEDPFLNLIKLL